MEPMGLWSKATPEQTANSISTKQSVCPRYGIRSQRVTKVFDSNVETKQGGTTVYPVLVSYKTGFLLVK